MYYQFVPLAPLPSEANVDMSQYGDKRNLVKTFTEKTLKLQNRGQVVKLIFMSFDKEI